MKILDHSPAFISLRRGSLRLCLRPGCAFRLRFAVAGLPSRSPRMAFQKPFGAKAGGDAGSRTRVLERLPVGIYMLSTRFNLSPWVGGVHTLSGKRPAVESRHAARRHGVVTSPMRAPLSSIGRPGRDVALSGECEIVIRSYFFDR